MAQVKIAFYLFLPFFPVNLRLKLAVLSSGESIVWQAAMATGFEQPPLQGAASGGVRFLAEHVNTAPCF